jgi:hypothetical protein
LCIYRHLNKYFDSSKNYSFISLINYSIQDNFPMSKFSSFLCFNGS